ncbi:MAG: argonaute/piwi family protein [bacterium]
MSVGIPTQLIWQGTLEGTTPSEDEATRAWNLWTGIYYKAGGVPWRVTGLDPSTCYVGLSFYRDRGDSTLRTAMAQAFSDRAEGIVLRGQPFRWDSTKSPHLPREQAKALLIGLLEAYRQHVQHAPARVVLHKWQRFEPEERAGFEDAVRDAGVDSADLVAFGDRDIRFFRLGTEPPIRGTTIYLAPGNALLYTRGYVPFLEIYPGMRVPRPIEITEHYGSSAIGDLCREVLALTKMDWNSAAFAGKAPITTDFAEDVGHILSELGPNEVPRPHYRFYM